MFTYFCLFSFYLSPKIIQFIYSLKNSRKVEPAVHLGGRDKCGLSCHCMGGSRFPWRAPGDPGLRDIVHFAKLEAGEVLAKPRVLAGQIQQQRGLLMSGLALADSGCFQGEPRPGLDTL